VNSDDVDYAVDDIESDADDVQSEADDDGSGVVDVQSSDSIADGEF
jgi:hypothetical protein